MNGPHWLKVLSYSMVLIFLILGGSSCSQQTETSPRIWIDSPLDGAPIPSGTTVTVSSHAYARQGIAEVVLSINGEAYRRDTPSSPGETYIQVDQDWQPTADGIYAVQVQAYDSTGQTSNIASVTVRVGEATPEATTPPLLEEMSPTPTATLAITETLTPPGSAVIQFWADPAQVRAGACTTIRWQVENASQVIFGGANQDFVGSYQDCLCENTHYTLTVVQLDGTELKQRVDITVTGMCETPTSPLPAQDTTPPPVPSPAVPSNGLALSCRSTQDLAWLPVEDPSGISAYYVKLEMQVTQGNWKSASGFGPLTDKQVNVSVQCGVIYRWMVRAQDGAGNFSDWSVPSNFSINMN